MKRLIAILLISSLLFPFSWAKFSNPFGEEHQNPNGKPFTLNVGYTYDFNSYGMFGGESVWFDEIDINMPITTWMTMRLNYNNDYWKESTHYHPVYENDPHEAHNNAQWIWYSKLNINFGADLHIPLYKLWEK